MTTRRPRLFDRLKKGLEDGVAYERGERTLRVTELVIPDPPQLLSAEDVQRIWPHLKP